MINRDRGAKNIDYKDARGFTNVEDTLATDCSEMEEIITVI